jgi:peptidoglycan-N-acetylglucosamine deacetylase
MKTASVPIFLRMFYPSLLWSMPQGNKQLYLTFDDGPHPEITPRVLDLLAKYDARATFFCVGENVAGNPKTYQQILDAGHLTGNHTYNHLNGWKTPLKEYYDSTNKCRELVDSIYFRPPYGRINPCQIQTLKKEYTIVMWSVLSYDYDHETSAEQCLDYVMRHTNDGAIIVFHDSEKAAPNLFKTLPLVLDHFTKEGYRFERLDT